MVKGSTLKERVSRGPSAVAHDMTMDGLLEWLRNPDIMRRIPRVTGHHVLIAPLPVETKTKGGILIPETHQQKQEVAAITGYVVQTGSTAYKGEYPKGIERFPEGPWCREGDFVLYRPFEGVRIDVDGQELRVMNDDQVLAVIEDPRGLSRI